MRTRWALAGVLAATWIAAMAIACSDDSLDGKAFGDPGAGSGSDASTFPPDENGGFGQASGVVIVHAAAFPSFRLCFEKLPELRPQPDSTVMPEANVVGVEVGSAVRIDPIQPPGKVYVISERRIRTTLGKEQPTCGQLICDGVGCLRKNADYHEVAPIDTPLGQESVHVLAITGCGNGVFLEELKISSSDCVEDYDPVNGSLRARAIPLFPASFATEKNIPVQLLHMSTPLQAETKNGTIDVSFGALVDAGADGGFQNVALSPKLFAPSEQVSLAVDQTIPSFYGTHGFRIGIRTGTSVADAGDGGPTTGPTTLTTVLTQSLAEVQELSAPGSVPTAYYLSASNYALLLLGDSRIRQRLADGGPNPDFDQRRALHLLALPIKEPKDGGTSSGGGDLPLDLDASDQ